MAWLKCLMPKAVPKSVFAMLDANEASKLWLVVLAVFAHWAQEI